jgi:hypothetical protein
VLSSTRWKQIPRETISIGPSAGGGVAISLARHFH